MKQILSGKLAQDPELKKIKDSDGVEQDVCNFTIFVYDGKAPLVERKDGSSYHKGIPLRCVAWGDNAKQIVKMKKGDTLTASSTMRRSEYTKQDGSKVVEPKYIIRRVDPENDIHKQLSQLLAGYEAGEYDQIREKEAGQPDFSKDRSKDRDLGKRKDKEEEKEAELDG